MTGLAFAAGACKNTPLVAPSGTVITLLATTNVLPVNGSTDIIALLIENGQTTTTTTTTTPGGATTTPTTSSSTGTAVHNGTVVSFTTTLGRIEPAEAKTANGQASVKLIADGRSGVATITAYSGGATKSIQINIGSAAAARILVSASPQALPPAGGTTTVTANVQDQQGNPIAGVPVTFSTSAGSLGQTSAVTDAFGNATTTLATTAAAKVTASAGGGTTGTLSNTVDITLKPASTVTLTVPTGVTVGVPASFTVGVGTSVIATGVTIDFGDGTTRDLGAISASTTISHYYSRLGTYTASVTGKFVDGSTTTVSSDVVVGDYTVTPTCPSNTTLGSTSTFSVSVAPSGLSIDRIVWDIIDSDRAQRTGNPVTYTWQSRGTKFITYTVVPSFAPSKSGSCTLEVN